MSDTLKIEFGCNGRQMDGWFCTDIALCDITKTPLPFDSDSASECYASHVVEHVSAADCMRFFREVHRILIDGGKFRVVVPAIGLHMERSHIADLCWSHGHCIFFTEESMRVMLYAAGFSVQKIRRTDRRPIDRHYLEIGDEKDAVESLHMEASK